MPRWGWIQVYRTSRESKDKQGILRTRHKKKNLRSTMYRQPAFIKNMSSFTTHYLVLAGLVAYLLESIIIGSVVSAYQIGLFGG